MVNGVRKEMFSEGRIALMREVSKNHPNLVATITMAGCQDWPETLAEIAAHCNVLLDGYYMPDELENLYGILHQKLRAKGQIIIHTGNGSIN